MRLVQGEAHFAVAKDPARPFVVTAGNVEVRAVGTAFAVECLPRRINIVVTEGTVAVDRPGAESGAADRVLVNAGNGLMVPAGDAPVAALRTEALPPAELERRLMWLGPRLELSGTPLAAAVAAFNRENTLQLAVDDPALAQMRMSGIFRADNVDGFVRLLTSNYGVQAERVAENKIVLRRSP